MGRKKDVDLTTHDYNISAGVTFGDEMTADQAARISKRLRKAMRDALLGLQEDGHLMAGFSMGVLAVRYEGAGISPETLARIKKEEEKSYE